MRVILAMAGQAIHQERRFRDVLDGVAGLAIEATVGPGQRIVRLRVVIVAPALPAVRVVTKRTVQAQAAFMMLVAMASVAIQRRALELQRAMALLASHDSVAADQRKSGDIVIEGRDFAPIGLAVTLLAAISQLALVLVILLVTRHTGRRQLVAIDIAGMAEIALDLHMRCSQRIFCLVMIEMNRFPLVLVVAAFALGTVPSGVNVLNPVAIHT